MPTLFDAAARAALRARLDKLSPQSPPAWGKMAVAQMLDHCTRAMLVPVGAFTVKPSFLRFVGRFLKGMALGGSPFGRNSPTAPEFVVLLPRDFDTEKINFAAALERFAGGEAAITVFEHAFFGRLTAAEWGVLLHKHAAHHLEQFGA
ncbi:MAG: DUF1569 domain-containing protein [Planctomycetes bacterium]|nr:DUF1569 domain-containing protein [Planctomycetota bacterium]